MIMKIKKLAFLLVSLSLASCRHYDLTIQVNYCNGTSENVLFTDTKGKVRIDNYKVAVPELQVETYNYDYVTYNVCSYKILEKKLTKTTVLP